MPAPARTPLPDYRPMLATPGTLPPPASTPTWGFEVKWDGQRILAHVTTTRALRLVARSGRDVTATYPELRTLPSAVTPGTVLDGEVVALGPDGRPDFERLQGRMGLTGARALAAAPAVPVTYLVFDVLHASGRDVTAVPYTHRRELLPTLLADGPAWATPGDLGTDGPAALLATRTQGLEGIVCKRLASPYTPGLRSPDWIKIRHLRTADVVVGGWVPAGGGMTGLPGAVHVGIPLPGTDRLRYAGGVGTGWTVREREELGAVLRSLATDDPPFADPPRIPGVRWVRPVLVGEVRHSGRTRAGLLRQPSWHRARPDLTPADLTPIDPTPPASS